MIHRRRGTSVAISNSVRPFFLAWLTLALLLFAFGRLSHAGDELAIGGLTVKALHTPGHTAGMLALVVDGNVFTGDTLFKGSVGGVRAPGSTSYADLKASVMDTLLTLPPDTVSGDILAAGNYRLINDHDVRVRIDVDLAEAVVVDPEPPPGWSYYYCGDRDINPDGALLYTLTDGVAAQVLTSPYHLVAVPKHGDVKWERVS